MPSLDFTGEFSYSARPVIPVRYVNPQTGAAFDSFALLDSGADYSMVNRTTLAILGFEESQLAASTSFGTTGSAVVYTGEILLEVCEVRMLATVLVPDQASISYNLLGRDPLFRYVHFAFEEYDDARRNRILWKLP